MALEKNIASLKFLDESNSKMIAAVIKLAPVSLIKAFTEIAFNMIRTNRSSNKMLKKVASKTISITKKKHILKPNVVKQLLKFFNKHYGS